MRTVKLSGELGKKYGRVHYFDVATPAEAIRALSVNFKGFHQELMTAHERNVGYKVITGGEALEKAEDALLPASKEIKIIPVIMGSGAAARIVLGAALVVVGLATGTAPLVSVGGALALGGVVELLSPVPRSPGTPERPENTASYLFNGPVNTTGQGHPVPIGYGRLIVGGALISAGISVDQLKRGKIRIQVEKSEIHYATGTPDNYCFLGVCSSPPANYFRKVLEGYFNGIGQPGDPFIPENQVWTWRFYYYETQVVDA